MYNYNLKFMDGTQMRSNLKLICSNQIYYTDTKYAT